METLLAAGRRPVTLEDRSGGVAEGARRRRLAPARLSFTRLPPAQWPGDQADTPGAAGQQMLGGQPADGPIVDADRGQRRLTGHAAHEHDGHGQVLRAMVRPVQVAADLRDGPDHAVHLACEEAAQYPWTSSVSGRWMRLSEIA